MITKIELKAIPFHKTSQTLDNLKKFNYFYGQNGTGKTTISRIIDSPSSYPNTKITWDKGKILTTKVYNRDFINNNFKSNPKGVFTLGKMEAETLENIEKTRSKIASLDENIIKLSITLNGEDGEGGKENEIKKLNDMYRDKFWHIKLKNEEGLRDALNGYHTKNKFMEKILNESNSNKDKILPIQELKEKAIKIFDKNIEEVFLIKAIDNVNILKCEKDPILNKVIVGKKDVDISEMISKLGNSDWVNQGINYYKNNNRICPFCQQNTTESLMKSLEEYFDETYLKEITEITKLINKYHTEVGYLQQQIQNIINTNSKYLDINGINLEKANLETILNENNKLLEKKQNEPSQTITLISIESSINNINTYVNDANNKIKKHNDIVKNIKKEKDILINQVWRYMVEELNVDITEYKKQKANIENAINSLKVKIRDTGKEKNEQIKLLNKLESNNTTIKPTCDAINNYLKCFGFVSFKLKISEDNLSYKLVRENGEDAKETLSDGEKNFVSFLYFYHLLKGGHSETEINNQKIVVIDDPISSLDNEILFIVSTLIRELIQEVREEKGVIKQIFILTHNLYFHKEVTYNKCRKSESLNEETFWLVKKCEGNSTIELQPTNPIKTSYELLWNEIKTIPRNNATIQNTMRRILENYFKILGNISLDKLYKKFEGENKIICKSLCSWVHDGSHNVFGEEYYTPLDDSMVTKYLEVFKEIFINEGQINHYNMMMA